MTQPGRQNIVARMSSEDWSDTENDAAVALYFSMLGNELSEHSYNKAANNRLLQEQTGRSRGSIEFKHCNISAAAKCFGLPIIKGYQPRFNFQMSLAEASSLFVGIAPTLRNTPPPEELGQMQAIARRFDVAGRDERNRDLGRAGEELVFHRERTQLSQQGRHDLAKRVRWVSQEDGDGAGYDIASFTQEGRERLIEVKTTNGWERTPFHISRNELEVAKARREDWHLFRLYEFA